MSTPSIELPSAETALIQDRIPGQSAITELLEVFDQKPSRSALGRIFGADPLGAASRPWFQGATGEIEVGTRLARLGPEWTVLHAVPVGAGDSDIDHVVIGPAGVFTINTKNHANKTVWVADRTLMVSGHRQNHIRNSVHEAARARKLLSVATGLDVPVAGILALVGTKRLDIRKKPSGTTVLTAWELTRWLSKQPSVLPEDMVAIIVTAANQPGTWHRAPQDAGSPAQLRDQFRQVQNIVQVARRRKAAWGFAGMAVMAAGIVAMINFLPAILMEAMQTLVP